METLREIAALYTFSMGFRGMVEKAAQEPPGTAAGEATVEGAVKMQFARMGQRAWRRDSFKGLLLLLHSKKCYRLLQNPENILILGNISIFGNKMVREPDTWIIDALTPDGQLSSLIRHCFAKYEVPEFMEYAFAYSNRIHMLWYVQMGRGDSVRGLSGFPVKFSGKMENIFRQTTTEFTINQAVRRAQALAYGATEHVADAIAWSSISASFDVETFRTDAIRFIARVHEDIGIDTLEEVWEYLFSMHLQNKAYSLKGRTWAAVCRHARAWRLDMIRRREAENFREWDNRMLSDFTLETEMVTFKVVQLTNSVALYEEGYEMSHCVADYTQDCIDGTSVIFSLRKYTKGEADFKRLATVELHRETKRIVQAKALYNDGICAEARMVILEWAGKESLVTDYEEECFEDQPAAVSIADVKAENNVTLRIVAFIVLQVILRILAKSCEQ